MQSNKLCSYGVVDIRDIIDGDAMFMAHGDYSLSMPKCGVEIFYTILSHLSIEIIHKLWIKEDIDNLGFL